MEKPTKIKIKKVGAKTRVLVLVGHPMTNNLRHDKENSNSVTTAYIEKMTFKLNGAVIAEAILGPGVAENPMTGITLKKSKIGDRVMASWIDSQGEHGSAEAVIM